MTKVTVKANHTSQKVPPKHPILRNPNPTNQVTFQYLIVTSQDQNLIRITMTDLIPISKVKVLTDRKVRVNLNNHILPLVTQHLVTNKAMTSTTSKMTSTTTKTKSSTSKKNSVLTSV